MPLLLVPDQQKPLRSGFLKSRLKTRSKLNVASVLLTAMLSVFTSQAAIADVFINEIHYDNTGSDSGEAIEIAGDAGTDLTGWTVVLYNGNNSESYAEIELSGVLPNQQDGFGTLEFTHSGIQNGDPDGMALVDSSNAVIQFLSYEGSFTATNGPAVGMTSVDIGVSEPNTTAVGNSLQLAGTGSQADDFSWEADSANTFGAINTNQIFGDGGPQVDTPPSIISTTPYNGSGVNAITSNIDISFSEGVDLSADWFDIDCSVSGSHTAIVDGGPQHYTLNSDVDFVFNEICTVNIVAALVADIDDNDPPDNMENDFSFSFATEIDSPIRINEVDADTAGSDTLEFVELYDGGVGNTPLDGLVIVLYNGSDSSSYNSAFDLDGFSTNSEGYFVLGNELVVPTPALILGNNGLQNGADAVALYVGNADDYPNDTPVSGIGLIDALVYDTNDSDLPDLLNVLTPNHPQINEDEAGNKDGHANARIPDGGNAIDTSVYVAQFPTPGSTNVTTAEIFDIQGAGLSSPFENGYVRSLNNVVTALDTNGFFMQTPTSRSDLNADTSDGIFVFTGGAPTVTVGDLVDVEGQVVEFFDFTEFSGGTLVSVISSGNSLPEVIVFDETLPSPIQPQPENEVERFEGMIVSFDGIATAATDRFGDTPVVAGSSRAYREPGIAFPGETDLPVWDGNPEIFEIDPDGLGGDNQTLFAGQSLVATGPLGFSFGDYQVWPTEVTYGPTPDLLAKVRPRELGEMTVGSLNMFRLFDSVDDADVDDEVVDADEYAIRLSKISRFVLEVMDAPDILAVSEVESLSVLDTLAAQIETDDNSVQYTAYLQEGNDIGGIDVGFLVRQSIAVDEVTQYGKDEILDFDGSLLNDRPPLLFKGRDISNGSDFPIQVLAVHNRSLSGIDDSSRGERVRAKRLAQAQFVAQLVQDIQTDNPDVNLIITGDFNAYQFSDGYVDVVGQISGTSVETDNLLWELSPVNPPLTNQVNTLPPEQQYSFVFAGSAQVLDHSLTTTHLDSMISDFSFTRGNSDVPANLVTDETTTMRASDHDGIVLFIKKDSDNDSVSDNLDRCPATSIPETAPTHGLNPGNYVLMDNDTIFDSTSDKIITLTDTAGCSCEQIAPKVRMGRDYLKHGCHPRIMKKWLRKLSHHSQHHNHGKYKGKHKHHKYSYSH